MFQLMPVFEVMILLMSFPKCLTENVLTFRFCIVLAHMFKLADFHKNCPRPAAGRLSTVFYGCGRPWLWSHGCGAARLWKIAAVQTSSGVVGRPASARPSAALADGRSSTGGIYPPGGAAPLAAAVPRAARSCCPLHSVIASFGNLMAAITARD